eukprot:scaffold20042_cov38-Cyclotella_meneghiniana.AAC.1
MEGGDKTSISLAEMSHFVGVTATLISRPMVVMRIQKFSETIEGVVVGELVLTAAEAAYSPLSIAFLVI